MSAGSSGSAGDAEMWQESLARVVPAIVVVRVLSVGPFDSESAGYGKATGFVVDKARGIILTNRHVVTPGPTMVDAVFMNKEEVDLVPIYYDPVHDFGFYRFDPKAVKFMEVAEVELNPDGAKVGVEIRVVGNDSGEKLSILPGILARLDRAAPEYDTGGYRDFNTFYLAAASSTSGGSSGSPVLTADGKAVALNCGARVETAAAFYLPLTKIVRALELIQRGEKVTRGTLQTVLRHTAFDEARRLGLKPDTEALLRKEFPEETGVLVVGEVVPKGPADGVLEPGDVVVRMKGETITTFLPWESALDDGVGGEVEVQVQRGGKEVIARLTVGDLHAITPAEYLDVSSSVLHPLSYQQARNYNLPVEGVYLAQAGYMLERAWISSQCLITSIGSDPTPDLDACEAALCKHADGARVSVRYKALGDRHRTKTAVITIDRKWYTMQRVRWNDEDGLWHATPSPPPPSAPPLLRDTPPVAPVSKAKAKRKGEAAGDGISSSLVMVVFDIPHLVDGVSGSYCIGVGVIVDAELGLVVVDRNTVQVSLGDVMLTFNGSEEVAAHPIFSHPTQNFGVVQFDPSLVSGSFTAAVLSSRETEHEDEDKDQDLEEECSDVEGGDDTAESGDDYDADDSGKTCVGGNAEPGDAENGGVNESGGSGGKTCDGGKVAADETAAADATAATADGDSKNKEEREAPTAGTTATPSPRPQLDDSNSSSCCKQSSTTTSTATVAGGGGGGGGGGGSDAADTPPPLRPGDTAEFYGLTASNAPVRQRAAVVKLERLSLASSAHPQFTAHTVEVLQFDQIASCIGGLFIAVPRSDSASPSPPRTGGDAKDPSPGKRKSVPVVSAFWHSFAFSTSDGRKQTMRGLPAPVVRRAVERLRRNLLLGKAKEEEEEEEGGSSVEHEVEDKQQQEEEGQEKQGLADNDSGVGVDGGPAEEGLDAAGAEAERELVAAAAQVLTAVAAASAAPATAEGAPTVAAAAAPVSREEPRADEGAAASGTAAAAAAAAGDLKGEGDQEDRAGGAAPAGAGAAGVSAEGSGRSLLGAAPCLPLQLVTLELSKARAGLGLSEKWSRRIERKCGERRQKQVLEVRRCMAGTPAFSVVETGDIILAVNGKLVTRFREVEVAVEEGEGSSVRLTILRELEERELTVKPSYLPTRETDRLFMWAGQMIQSPHLAVLQLGFLPKEGGGVYSSRWCYGSPAHKYSLGCTTWIVEVNGIPTPNLDAFLDVVRHIGDKSPARVKTVGLDSKVEVTTLRTDHHYWPTLELRRTGDCWTRTLHKGAPAITTSTTPDTATTADTASVSSVSPETSSVASTSTPASCEIPGSEADAAEEGGKETFEDDAADANSRELPAAGGGVAPVLEQEQTDSTVGGSDKGGDHADTDGASDEQTE